MSAVRRLLTVGVVLCAVSFAQVDNFYWTTALIGAGSVGCQMCVYDITGTVVASFPYPGLLSAPTIAKHPGGTVWATDSFSGQIIPYTLAGMGTPVPASNVGSICVDIAGDLWTYEGGFFLPVVLTRRDPLGNPIQTVTPTGLIALDIQGDPFGNVWVLDAIQGSLEKVSPAGVISGPFVAPQQGPAGGFDIDPQGNPWVLITSSAGTSLVKFLNSGQVAFSVPMAGATTFALDGHGNARVVVTGPPATLTVLDASGAQVASAVLPAGVTYDGIAVDAAGRSWLSSLSSQLLDIYDCSGLPVNTISLAYPPLMAGKGDQTGLHLSSVLFRAADTDGDGVSNGPELQIGTDPLDGTVTPPVLTVAGIPFPGSTVTVGMTIPGEAGFPYIITASGGTNGIPVAPVPWCREIPLALDPLLLFWLAPGNPFATGVTGSLSALGQASSTVFIPPGPLSGLTFVMGAVTLDPTTGNVSAITAPAGITIQ